MGWTRSQALAFLAPVSSLSELADADGLAAALHDDPVALHVARSFLKQHPVGTARYAQVIQSRRAGGDLLPMQIALARARLSLPAWQLARVVAYLAAEPLQSDWAQATIPVELGGADAEAVADLWRYGLISLSQDGELLRMHATIQDAVRAADPRHRGAWLSVLPMLDAFDSSEEPASWLLSERLDGHAQRLTEHLASIRRMRKIRQALLRRLGDYARSRGRSERAALLYEVALRLAHDQEARSELHFQLGLAQGDDQPEASRDNLRQAVALAVRAHGAGHPSIARNRHALSHAHERLGELAEARRELERALHEGETYLGKDDLNLAVGRHSLGDLLRQEGNLQRSKEILEGTLAELITAVGTDDHRVTACRTGLAKTYMALGDLPAAREQLEQALAADLRLVGPDHPHVCSDQAELDEVLRALGEGPPDDRPPDEADAQGHAWVLEPSAFTLDRTGWRWRLTGPDGAVHAEHEVTLDPAAAEYHALIDLDGWLRWRPAPDRRRSDEQRLLRRLGEWIGQTVLGPVATALAGLPTGGRTVTVRVRIPPEASWLPAYPLDLAIPPGSGEPLALLPIRLVYEVAGAAVEKQPAGRRLRVLAILSTPSGGVTLDLRRERLTLERLAAAHPDRVDLRVLQYGCTLEQLADAVADPRGWDILHLAGHGGPGELMLETDDGAARPVPAGELLRILDAVRDRVRLLIASWCSSALDDALSVLELEPPEDLVPDQIDAPVVSGLGARLAARLACTVLAMRHPVGDSLSARLAEEVYPRLLAAPPPSWEDAIAAGIGLALRGTTPLRPLWLAAPVIFTAGHTGAAAPDPVPPVADELAAETAADDGPAEVFTGRVGLLARLRHSGPAVVLSGMPGVGKTACARELAWMIGDDYRRTVWCRPDELDHIAVGDHELIIVDGLASPWTERQCDLVTELARQASDRSGRLVVTARPSPPAGLPEVTAAPLVPLAPAEAAWLVQQLGLATGGAARQLLTAAGGVPGLLDGSTGREEVAGWARHEFESMSPEELAFVAFLCALEADDRDSGPPVEMLWDPVRRELTGEDVDASAVPHVSALVRRGLAATDEPPASWQQGAWGARLCPPVLDAAGTLLDEDTATLVAKRANEYWTFLLQDFRKREADSLGEAIVYLARRVVPYRLRLRDWRGVRAMLGLIWQHDPAPDLAPAVAARLRRSGPQPGGDPEALTALLSELEARSSPKTEADLHAAIKRAEAEGDPGRAAELGFELINLLVLAGRAEQALPMAERLPGLGRAAGADRLRICQLRAQRAQVLVAAGRFDEGLKEAERLLKQVPGGRDAGHVEEVLHNIAFRAAMKLEQFPVALKHSEAIAAGLVRRRAPELDQARELLNTALVRRDSGRPDLARQLVLRAREVFEAARNVEGLIAARVSLAELEAREGRFEDAVLLARDVLRLEYTSHPSADPADRRLAHLNLSAFLVQAGQIRDEALCHLVAATIIDGLAGSWRAPQTLESLLEVAARYELMPSSLEELDRQLAVTPGVRFLPFVATLPGGIPAAEEAFRELQPIVRYAPENMVMRLMEQMGLPVAYVDLDTGETIERGQPRTLTDRIGRRFRRR